MTYHKINQPRTLKENLPQASLTIATAIAVAFLFRGTTSLLAVMIIPILLYLFLSSYRAADYWIISIALVLLTFLFITTQTIFMIIDVFLGLALRVLFKRKLTIIRVTVYFISVTALLFVGILLTQLIFAIPLHTFMLRISRDNAFIYLLILSLESILITGFHTLLSKRLSRFI